MCRWLLAPLHSKKPALLSRRRHFFVGNAPLRLFLRLLRIVCHVFGFLHLKGTGLRIMVFVLGPFRPLVSVSCLPPFLCRCERFSRRSTCVEFFGLQPLKIFILGPLEALPIDELLGFVIPRSSSPLLVVIRRLRLYFTGAQHGARDVCSGVDDVDVRRVSTFPGVVCITLRPLCVYPPVL